MIRHLVIATLLCIGSCTRLDCNDWNSAGFFRKATAADVKRCLAAGANIEARSEFGGRTPLHLAVCGGNSDRASVLIKAGAEVNACAKGDSTPLHRAARDGNAETVTALIKAGADIRAKTNNGSLLAYLAEHNPKVRNHDIFQALNAARR